VLQGKRIGGYRARWAAARAAAPAGPGDGGAGRTSLAGLKDCCWWHHHVLLHRRGWRLTARPDGTSEARSPAGRIIRSHGPPPRPG
jgi:hypothetical protein